MTSRPLWFTSGKLSLFGWMDLPPSGHARAGVVLCPPLGHELLLAHDALRALAEHLAERGFAVLRFDYPGTGDSADDPMVDNLVPLWLGAVGDAVQCVHSTGVPRVAVIGMRMGALMVALVTVAEPVEAIVLWDPNTTGRAFLRQQRALAALSAATVNGVEGAAPAEFPGSVYSEHTVAHVSTLRLDDAPRRLAAKALILLRDPSSAAGIAEHFEGNGTTLAHAEGQSELLERSTVLSKIPFSTVERISAWMDSTMASDLLPVAMPLRDQAVVNQSDGIIERFVELGPIRLFGIRTEPAHPTDRPVVLFLNVATEVHIGPSRQWVLLSRALAAHGFSSVRVDLSGLGDSPVRYGKKARLAYGPHLVDDVHDALAALSPSNPANVVVIGLCSGGYTALQAATSFGLRGLIAINPAAYPAPELTMDTVRRAANGRQSKPVDRFVQALPLAFWRLGSVLHLWRSPAEAFATVTAHVDDMLIVSSTDSARTLTKRGGWIIDRLAETGRFNLISVDVDHSLLGEAGRATVATTVADHLLARYPGPDQPMTRSGPDRR